MAYIGLKKFTEWTHLIFRVYLLALFIYFFAIADQRPAWVIPLLLHVTLVTVHLPTCPIGLHHQSTERLLPLIICRHRLLFI